MPHREPEPREVSPMVDSNQQISAMSEFIGRQSVLLEQGSAEDISSNSLYDVRSREPLDIDEVRDRRDNYIEETRIDNTTGAYSREELFRRYGRGFSEDNRVLAIDVAGLKVLNDFYGGHKTGDIALKGAVSAIASIIPGITVFRTGGDEFVAVSDDDVTQEQWEKVNDLYLSTINEVTEKKVGKDRTFLRAGQTSPTKEEVNNRPDGVISRADNVEIEIKLLINMLGSKKDVPLLATPEELEDWKKRNKIKIE